MTQESHLLTLCGGFTHQGYLIEISAACGFHADAPGSGSAETTQYPSWKEGFVEEFVHQLRELQQEAVGSQTLVSLLYCTIRSTK